jgi:predicted metal-dependent hydrolase
MLFIEEEIEIQLKGANGYYGLLREVDNGKYIANIIIIDNKDFKKVSEMFQKNTDIIVERFARFAEENKDELLALPFLNKKVTLELINWLLIPRINGGLIKK